MFGYVKAWKPELRICEFEAYKSVYCGLCKEMGKRFGLWSRFTLSYDFTFLAMLGMALAPNDPAVSRSRCPLNPLKRINTCHDSAALSFAGEVAILMLWHKLEDNRADGGLAQRLACVAVMPVVRGAYRKAAANHQELAGRMKDAMEEQARLEEEGCTDLDHICHPSAHMLGSVLEELAGEQSGQARVLYRLGYLLGRYVYISDALDDLEQDNRAGGYNPLLRLAVEAGESDATTRERAKGSLFMTIAEAGTAYELLEIRRFGPILENILLLGLRKNVETIVLPQSARPKMR